MKTYRVTYTVWRDKRKLYDNEKVEQYAISPSIAERLAQDFIMQNRGILPTDTFIINGCVEIENTWKD
jgi:hypothetical protein